MIALDLFPPAAANDESVQDWRSVLLGCRILPISNLCARRPFSHGRAAAGGALQIVPCAFDQQREPLAGKTDRTLCLTVRAILPGHRFPQTSQAFVFNRLPRFLVRAIRPGSVSVRWRESAGEVFVRSGRAKGRIRGRLERRRTRGLAARHAGPRRLRSVRSSQKVISAPYTRDQNYRGSRRRS